MPANISNGLLMWALKIEKMEKCLDFLFKDPKFYYISIPIKLKVILKTTDFLSSTYFLIKTSRRRFANLIEDLSFIEAFLHDFFVKRVLEFMAGLIENLQKKINFNEIFLFEEIATNLLKIWIKIKQFSQYKLLLDRNLSDLQNLIDSLIIKNKNQTAHAKGFTLSNQELNLESFKYFWEECYLKIIKIVFGSKNKLNN